MCLCIYVERWVYLDFVYMYSNKYVIIVEQVCRMLSLALGVCHDVMKRRSRDSCMYYTNNIEEQRLELF